MIITPSFVQKNQYYALFCYVLSLSSYKHIDKYIKPLIIPIVILESFPFV